MSAYSAINKDEGASELSLSTLGMSEVNTTEKHEIAGGTSEFQVGEDLTEEFLPAQGEKTEGAIGDFTKSVVSKIKHFWDKMKPQIEKEIHEVIFTFLTALASGQNLSAAAHAAEKEAIISAGDLVKTTEAITSDEAKAAAIAKINANTSLAQDVKALMIQEVEKQDHNFDNFTTEHVDSLVHHLTSNARILDANEHVSSGGGLANAPQQVHEITLNVHLAEEPHSDDEVNSLTTELGTSALNGHSVVELGADHQDSE